MRRLAMVIGLLACAAPAWADCDTLSPRAKALMPWMTSAEAGTPPQIYIPGRTRAFLQKGVQTYRVLSPTLAQYARDSMRFWAALLSCESRIVQMVEVPAGDDTAMHTWRLGKAFTLPCPTPITIPLSNGAGSPWWTKGCDLVTLTKAEYVFTSPSRFTALHEPCHIFVMLRHTATGVCAKKQTCNWSSHITPEQNALNPCWIDPVVLEATRWIYWHEPGVAP